MFSPALEVVLTVAYREATSRQAHAPDARAPALRAGARSGRRADPRRLRRRPAAAAQAISTSTCRSRVEQFTRGQQKEPEQTLAFRRVLQTAVLHVQSAGRQEVQSGDVLAATLQQTKSYAAQLLAAQGVTRLDVLEYITHGISKVPPVAPAGRRRAGRRGDAEAGLGERGGATVARSARRLRHQPDRAGQGRRARSADRPAPTSCSARSRSSAGGARTIRSSSATPASARPRSPKGWRRGCSATTCPELLAGRGGLLARHRRRCSPARASAATSRSASRR